LHKYRTHTCSEITKKNSGSAVKLSGWIHRKRDHGNLLFFDLRDHYGLTQCVTENSSDFFKEIEKVKPDIISTGNIGCIAQIANGTTIPILHTVEIIDWYTGGPKPKILSKL